MKSIPAVTFKVSVHNTPTHPEGKTTTQNNTNPARLPPVNLQLFFGLGES